jgi:hypothetical protein
MYLKFFLALLIIFTSGCTGKHLISNKAYLANIEKSFIKRKDLAANRETELLSVFSRKLSMKQREALKALFKINVSFLQCACK